ncbi:MAG TPA: class I SAM-dependent methyltransferase [Candidatus Paceibacterota bacterium]|nr:class I SAM-dependent methyltransferase [Candidatus Paceibacterota bacterium]
MNNKELYESDEVVNKYANNSVRSRSLNNPEKFLIDRFDIKNKDVLVLGSGAGRVPVNLLLFGNRVKGVDRSVKLNNIANENFPNSKFKDLSFELGDITDLSNIPDNHYDVVIFAMNTLDYVDSCDMRDKAILEAYKKVKNGGIIALSSHNKLAYLFPYKIKIKNLYYKSLFEPYYYSKENVIGGGCIFKGNPSFIIESIKKLTNMSFEGFMCDTRNKFDKLLAKKISVAQFIFPYLLYVFRK